MTVRVEWIAGSAGLFPICPVAQAVGDEFLHREPAGDSCIGEAADSAEAGVGEI
jgi:hypothetical protein